MTTTSALPGLIIGAQHDVAARPALWLGCTRCEWAEGFPTTTELTLHDLIERHLRHLEDAHRRQLGERVAFVLDEPDEPSDPRLADLLVAAERVAWPSQWLDGHGNHLTEVEQRCHERDVDALRAAIRAFGDPASG